MMKPSTQDIKQEDPEEQGGGGVAVPLVVGG